MRQFFHVVRKEKQRKRREERKKKKRRKGGKGSKRKGKEGKREYEYSEKREYEYIEKKSLHAADYPVALLTGKYSPSEPLHNPSSYARKLPAFTDLIHF